MFNLNTLIRDNIKTLKPYSSARHEFTGKASVFLDANENAYGSPLPEKFNRYPDPLQWQLKFQLARIKGVPAENIFVGNGSDEVIDLAYRIFCNPSKDNVIVCPPTYGMYEVSGNINDVEIRKVNLTNNFQLNVEGIMAAVDANTKLIFICSPNNPTGNNMHREDVETVLNNFSGIVIIDEAYINFSRYRSFTQELNDYPNLVVMQTLSKAWGLAALRLGMAFASTGIINVMNKIKPPYNINQASQELALQALNRVEEVNEMIREIVKERKTLEEELPKLGIVKKVHPSDGNFLLAQVTSPVEIYRYLLDKGIVVRDRSRIELCEGCLRITVGTHAENKTLLLALDEFQAQ